MLKRAAVLATILAPTACLPALAQVAPVTPERAVELQGQIRAWLQSTLGDAVRLDSKDIAVTAAGDHFDVTYPLAAARGTPPVTGKLTEQAGGRWSLDDVMLPSPAVFDMRVPTGKGATADGTATVTFGEQKQHLLIDPSLATPMTGTSSFRDMSIAAQLPSGTQLSHIDAASSDSVVTPVGDGRFDVTSRTKLDGYTAKQAGDGADGRAVAISIGSAALASNVAGVSRDRALQALQLLGQFRDAHRADKAAGAAATTPRDRALGRELFAALADLARSGTVTEDFSNVTVSAQGLTGSLEKAGLGLDVKTADGKLQARMPLAATGLALPDLGLGAAMRLVPTKLSLTPSVAGVPTDAVVQLGNKAIDGQPVSDADVEALFRAGPINVGLDDFHLDVAGSSFDGTVAMAMASPADMSGTGQISATNVDSLQQAMLADPRTAQAAPVLILAKGMARNEGGRLVWDIAYRGGHLVVNGQDLQALMGAVAPPAGAPAARRPPARPGSTRP